MSLYLFIITVLVFFQFKDGKAQLKLGLDEVWTLTTVKTGQKGMYADPPASKPFPLPYTDDFEGI